MRTTMWGRVLRLGSVLGLGLSLLACGGGGGGSAPTGSPPSGPPRLNGIYYTFGLQTALATGMPPAETPQQLLAQVSADGAAGTFRIGALQFSGCQLGLGTGGGMVLSTTNTTGGGYTTNINAGGAMVLDDGLGGSLHGVVSRGGGVFGIADGSASPTNANQALLLGVRASTALPQQALDGGFGVVYLGATRDLTGGSALTIGADAGILHMDFDTTGGHRVAATPLIGGDSHIAALRMSTAVPTISLDCNALPPPSATSDVTFDATGAFQLTSGVLSGMEGVLSPDRQFLLAYNESKHDAGAPTDVDWSSHQMVGVRLPGAALADPCAHVSGEWNVMVLTTRLRVTGDVAWELHRGSLSLAASGTCSTFSNSALTAGMAHGGGNLATGTNTITSNAGPDPLGGRMWRADAQGRVAIQLPNGQLDGFISASGDYLVLAGYENTPVPNMAGQCSAVARTLVVAFRKP